MSEKFLSPMESYQSVATIPGMERLPLAERSRIWKESFVATSNPWRTVLFGLGGLALGAAGGYAWNDLVVGLWVGPFVGVALSGVRHVRLARTVASQKAMAISR